MSSVCNFIHSITLYFPVIQSPKCFESDENRNILCDVINFHYITSVYSWLICCKGLTHGPSFISVYYLVPQLWKVLCTTNWVQKQLTRGVLKKRCVKNMMQIYRKTPILKCNFNKVALQLYWNRTLEWVFSCKFTVYFQNTFF